MRQKGFTIVELLIVIVVIGILAAITVVAYSGVQQKAQNSNRIATARQAVSLVNAYIAASGHYPFETYTGRCIGSGYPDGKCWGVDSPTPAYVGDSGELNDALKTIGTLPKVSYGTVDMGYWRGIGPVYHYSASRTVDGVPSPAIIVYFLDGLNQDCGLDGVVRQTNAGTPGQVENSNTYKTVTSSPRNTASSGAGTYCIIAAHPAG